MLPDELSGLSRLKRAAIFLGLQFKATKCRDGEVRLFISSPTRVKIIVIVTVGIDFAKGAFAMHGMDKAVKLALVRPAIDKGKILP